MSVLHLSEGVSLPEATTRVAQPANAVGQCAPVPAPPPPPIRILPIRVGPIPDVSPPAIDFHGTGPQTLGPFVQGTFAISFIGNRDPAADDPRDLRHLGPQRTLSADLPEPDAWVTHMAQALIEVMSGARPAPQVIRWTTAEVYSAVARRNAASGRRTRIARQSVVRRVRICEPVDGIIEACAVVADNGRVRALAMRLIGVDGRWVVSALQVG